MSPTLRRTFPDCHAEQLRQFRVTWEDGTVTVLWAEDSVAALQLAQQRDERVPRSITGA